MKIRMLVSISRTGAGAFSAHIGQELELEDRTAVDLIQAGQAEAVGTIKLPQESRRSKRGRTAAVPAPSGDALAGDAHDAAKDGET